MRRRRGYRRLKGGFGSKSFNDLDDGDRHSGAAGAGNGRGSGRLRSSTLSSFNTSFDSVSSNVQVIYMLSTTAVMRVKERFLSFLVVYD